VFITSEVLDFKSCCESCCGWEVALPETATLANKRVGRLTSIIKSAE